MVSLAFHLLNFHVHHLSLLLILPMPRKHQRKDAIIQPELVFGVEVVEGVGKHMIKPIPYLISLPLLIIIIIIIK